MKTPATALFASLLAAMTLLSSTPAAATPPPATASAAEQPVVFSRLIVPDGDQPAIEAGVWLTPAPAGEPRPLVVISHGNGGDFRSHADTAEALARAGFIVAALTHTGDNWRDQSRATDIADRPRQLSALIDHMLQRWEGRAGLDQGRVGAFGFSAGGFTVLAAAGGKPDLARVLDHCRAHGDFYDCRLMAARPVAAPSAPWMRDSRIKAIVVAAPALGFTFTPDGLGQLDLPVQLWEAGADQVLPAPWYAEPVRDALPRRPEFHRIEGAGHFDFLRPCDQRLAAAAPAICAPTPGFDRVAFHADFNREVVRFLGAAL